MKTAWDLVTAQGVKKSLLVSLSPELCRSCALELIFKGSWNAELSSGGGNVLDPVHRNIADAVCCSVFFGVTAH